MDFHSYVILVPQFPVQNRRDGSPTVHDVATGLPQRQALGWFSEVRLAEMAPDVATWSFLVRQVPSGND